MSASSWVLVGCAVALPLCLLAAAVARTAAEPPSPPGPGVPPSPAETAHDNAVIAQLEDQFKETS